MPGAQLEDEALRLARRIAGLFRADPRVKAVTLCGSRTSGAAVDTRPTSTCMSIPRRVITRSTSAGPSSSAWAGRPCASLGLTFGQMEMSGLTRAAASRSMWFTQAWPGSSRSSIARCAAADPPGVHHLRLGHRPHGVDPV